MNKQFKFTSRSSLSFSVNAHGRQAYVNFSPAYRGLSYFITKDEVLAARIRAHRWFREGRITEAVEELLPPKKEQAYIQAPMPEKKKYSILGKTMAAPRQKQEPATEASTASSVTPESPERPESAAEEPAPSIISEDVASFMEAKEFFITNYGVQRSDVSTKEAVAALCRQFNVVFPNYPL